MIVPVRFLRTFRQLSAAMLFVAMTYRWISSPNIGYFCGRWLYDVVPRIISVGISLGLEVEERHVKVGQRGLRILAESAKSMLTKMYSHLFRLITNEPVGFTRLFFDSHPFGVISFLDEDVS